LLALQQAFETWITKNAPSSLAEFCPDNIILRPLLYGQGLSNMLPREKETHYAITVLILRNITFVPGMDNAHWKRWIAMMMWLGHSDHTETFWNGLVASHGENATTANLWDAIEAEINWIEIDDQIPYVNEIRQTYQMLSLEDQWISGSFKRQYHCLCQNLVRRVSTVESRYVCGKAPK
jgi:hypothetical protein